MAGGDDGGLDDEEIDLARADDLRGAVGEDRGGRDGYPAAPVSEFSHAAFDELILEGLAVGLLEDSDSFLGGRGGDSLEHRVGVFVAALEALEMEHGEATQLTHGGGGARIYDGVHGGGEHGEFETESGDVGAEVYILGIEGDRSGHECDVVEAKGLPRFASAADCYVHASTTLLRSGSATANRSGAVSAL